MNDYNILAKYIADRYIDTLTGNDIEDKLIGEDPANRVMVGMLSEDRVDESFEGAYKENTATQFESVPSISLSFKISKESKGNLYIKLSGLLFYNIKPTRDEVIQYFLETYSKKDKRKYTFIEELIENYETKLLKVPEVYRKIEIAEVMGKGIVLDVTNLEFGLIHLQDKITEKLDQLRDKIIEEICILSENKLTFHDLLDDKSFNKIVCPKEATISPRWTFDIACRFIEKEGDIHGFIQLVNKTPINKGSGNLGYSPKLFNAGLSIVGEETVKFKEIELDYLKTTYKKREAVYAIGENTSAEYNKKENKISTQNVPIYTQYRIKTKDQFNQYIAFERLIEEPVKSLNVIYEKLKQDYIRVEREYDSKNRDLPKHLRQMFKDDLDKYQMEVNRFKKGIEQITYKDFVARAFKYMNETFASSLDGKENRIKGWRLFQIVFIVSLIPYLIRSEYKDDEDLRGSDIEEADLLYFPTGGGKTEAFLGTTVFTMFFDRIRGKQEGVTAMIKYPLRLLAVQQLERVLNVMMKANTVIDNREELRDWKKFSVGFFVGKENTPNKITPQEKLSKRGKNKGSQVAILESDTETLNEYYRFIDTCPVCGKKSINMVFDEEYWCLHHRCDNPQCNVKELPVHIVDNEIYRFLPTVIVSTIDKMALLGISNDFKLLFGQTNKRCIKHGFMVSAKCRCGRGNCSSGIKTVNLKDPVPTLFIQDELHLVKESLGTFDSHYESFINYYAKTLVREEDRKNIRFIGATATISEYENHIHNLYHMKGRRFPCAYPDMTTDDNFYAYTDINDITRFILGYAPYGRSIINGVWESVYQMRLLTYDIMVHAEEAVLELKERGFKGNVDDVRAMMYNYWIELLYNNRKKDADELYNSFTNQGNNHLLEQGVPLFNIETMTSDTDFQTVRKTLFDIQANKENLDSINLILATSTISHGVDEDAFNIMYFYGMPNNNAEYIQAYSRTGRRYTGIVVDIHRLMRVRDRSYLKNFMLFHKNKDDLVESVPINRWAKNAIYSTLPGILTATLYQYYTIKVGIESFYYTKDVKKHLQNETIDVEELINIVINAYGCTVEERMSSTYAEIIREEVERIMYGLANDTFAQDEMLTASMSKYTHGRKCPMTSLRDTEEQIEIKIE